MDMPTKLIDVGEKFKRQNLPNTPTLQAPYYTAYPLGAKKIGLICQDGLAKRKLDAEVLKKHVMTNKPYGGKGTFELVHEVKPIPTNKKEAPPNVGVLTAVDKFFDWINRVLK